MGSKNREGKVDYFWLKDEEVYKVICDTKESFSERYEAYKALRFTLCLSDTKTVLKELIRLREKGEDVTKHIDDCNYNIVDEKFPIIYDMLDFEEKKLLEDLPDKWKREAMSNFIDKLKKM